LGETTEVVAMADNRSFDLELAVDVVEISRRLDWVVAKHK